MKGFKLRFETTVLAKQCNGYDFEIEQVKIVNDWDKWKTTENKTVEKECEKLVKNAIRKSNSPYICYAKKMVDRGAISCSIKHKSGLYPLSSEELKGSYKDLIDWYKMRCPHVNKMVVIIKLIFPYEGFGLRFKIRVVAKQPNGSDFTIVHGTFFETSLPEWKDRENKTFLEECKNLDNNAVKLLSVYKYYSKNMVKKVNIIRFIKLKDGYHPLSDE